MGIGSEFINARMMETLLTNDFSSELIDTEWFSFKESLAVKGAFLIIEISHKPTPCARKYLERNFLLSKDRILNWYDDHARSSPLRSVSTISIDLGTKQTPPKRLTRGIFAKNQEDVCDGIRQETDLYKKAFEVMKKMPELANLPELERYKVILEEYLKDQAGRYKVELDIMKTLQKTPPHVNVFDPLDMRCDIKFIQRYCPLCHTTEHSFRECTKKGCKVCGNNYHPDYECPKKCKCRKRPYHFPDNCPVKARPIAHCTLGDLMPKIQQKTTNQNVNAAKQKDNSSTRKNHNMYEAFNNEDESEDAMNTEEDAPQVQVQEAQATSQPMDIEPNPQEGQVGAEDDGEKRKIPREHQNKYQRGHNAHKSQVEDIPRSPTTGTAVSSEKNKEKTPESPVRAHKSDNQHINAKATRLSGLNTTPKQGTLSRSTLDSSTKTAAPASTSNHRISNQDSMIDFIANSVGKQSRAEETGRDQPVVPPDDGSDRSVSQNISATPSSRGVGSEILSPAITASNSQSFNSEGPSGLSGDSEIQPSAGQLSSSSKASSGCSSADNSQLTQ
ncbi:hypothetical protein JCM33374_g3662 [Metschnikowia sp. JCM 33374]|nr:hypothetical protein JCM33374_g3662 [Metschnikowia sp. JCM 33374]